MWNKFGLSFILVFLSVFWWVLNILSVDLLIYHLKLSRLNENEEEEEDEIYDDEEEEEDKEK